MSTITAWNLIGPLGLLLALLGFWLHRLGAGLRWATGGGRGLLIAGLTVFAGWAAGYLGFFATWLYAPVLRGFRDNPVALPAAVYTQALLMSGAVLAACRRRWRTLLPLMVFAVAVLGFGAWLTVHPDQWLPPLSSAQK